MLKLCAVTGPDSSLRRLYAEESTGPDERPYRRDCRRRDVYMFVEGNQPVDSCFLDDPEFTLICRVDLLGSDFPINVAAYLGRLYREQGDGFVRRLRGTFAIIVFDHSTRTMKAWTDHFGVERLLFAESGKSLTVATDMRQLLLASGLQPAVSLAAIQEYLQYTCIPTPKTIYSGISKLAPGHQLISRPSTATKPYWDMVYEERRRRTLPEKAWATQTKEAVRSAVALTLKSSDKSRTPGCFLSGGTDSSSVTGLVGQLTAQPPRTFSIGFDDPRYNEIQYARIAAKRFSADHHEYFVKPGDVLSLIQKAVRVYDEPFGNSSIVPTYYCARLAREHGITHLLAGDGGDELFGGNARYVDDRVFQKYAKIPRWMRASLVEPIVSRAARSTNLRLFKLAASYVRRSNVLPPDRYFSYSLISSMAGDALFTRDFLASVNNDPLATARNHFRAALAQSDLNRWLYLDLKITITDNDLRKVTMMSRLAGVTPRYPFLDPDLAEFTGTIPPDLKVRGSQLRYLFKKAMQGFLPEEIIKKSKHGFGLPYSVWLADSTELRDFTFDVLGSARCRQRGYFRPDLLEWLWSQYESVHRGYYGEILWILLMLELWHVHHTDVPVAAVADEQTGRAIPQFS